MTCTVWRRPGQAVKGRKPLLYSCKLETKPLAGADAWRVQTPKAVKRAQAPVIQREAARPSEESPAWAGGRGRTRSAGHTEVKKPCRSGSQEIPRCARNDRTDKAHAWRGRLSRTSAKSGQKGEKPPVIQSGGKPGTKIKPIACLEARGACRTVRLGGRSPRSEESRAFPLGRSVAQMPCRRQNQAIVKRFLAYARNDRTDKANAWRERLAGASTKSG